MSDNQKVNQVQTEQASHPPLEIQTENSPSGATEIEEQPAAVHVAKRSRKKTAKPASALVLNETSAETEATPTKRKRRKRLTLEEALEATQTRTGTREPSAEAETVDEALSQFAGQLGEDSGRIRQQTDSMRVLEMMTQGVVANLTIERPRFLTHVRAEDLGLNFSNRKMQEVLKQYFQLGRRSLLPKPLQDRLNAAEAKARACLERYSFRSHWGRFIPATSYAQWKEENEACQIDFFALRDEVVEQYQALIRDVVGAYLPIAEDAWRRSQLQDLMAQEVAEGQIEGLDVFEDGTNPGEAVATPAPQPASAAQPQPEINPEQYRPMLTRFKSEHGKRDFILNYLRRIRAAMPTSDTIAGKFVYNVDLSYIPLPSLLARDVQKADTVYQERAIQNAEYQTAMRKQKAEQEKAEAEVWAVRRAEQEKRDLEMQLERAKTQTELNRLRAQQQMERDIVEQARIQKEKLVREFFEGVVGEVNTAIFEVCDGAAQSIERNNGRLTGSVAMQLRNLITRLEAMNFSGDIQIEQQLNRLRAVLPPVVIDPVTKRASSAIDNSAVRQLVRELRREAEGVLIDLGHMPVNRRAMREQANVSSGVVEYNIVDRNEAEATSSTAPNRRRRMSDSANLSENQEIETDDTTAPLQSRRRTSRRSYTS